jgi:hypothetical protein
MKKIISNNKWWLVPLMVFVAAVIAFASDSSHLYNASINAKDDPAKYNTSEFKSYKTARLFCDQFYGGTNESDGQLYSDMLKSHGFIGC